MKIKFTGDAKLKAKLSRVERSLLTRKIMGKMAIKAQDIIEQRTDKGKDKDGKGFAEYSEEYKRSKIARANKKQKVKYKGHPNLQFTGEMFRDFTFFVKSKTEAFLHFPDGNQEAKALKNINGRGVPRRDFLGVTAQERDVILRIPDKNLKKLMDD